jgi:hypothetical protein
MTLAGNPTECHVLFDKCRTPRAVTQTERHVWWTAYKNVGEDFKPAELGDFSRLIPT